MTRQNALLILAAAAMLTAACKRETKDERFRREFEAYTQKECPKLIDQDTRMDSISYTAQPQRTLTEYYTVMNALDQDTLYADKKLIGTLREQMLGALKSSIQLKPYKDEGVTFCYSYRSHSSGRIRLLLTFTPDDYNN